MQNVEKISAQTILSQSEISSTITAASLARCAIGTWRASPSYWTARIESTVVRTTRGEENKLVCALLQILIRRFCSVCGGCGKVIVPKKGETKVRKLRALGKDYHLNCFKCEVSLVEEC